MATRNGNDNNKNKKRAAGFALVAALAALAVVAPVVEAAPAKAVTSAPKPFELPKNPVSKVNVSFGSKDISVAGVTVKKPVWSQTINLKQVDPTRKNVFWTRLTFDATQTKLRKPKKAPTTAAWGADQPGDVIRITSVLDKAVQYLNADSLAQWSFQSAFFNGPAVTVELLADPAADATVKPAVIVTSVTTNDEDGFSADPINLPPPTTLCNAADLRKPATDLRSGRIFPVGCTGWTINDKNGCHTSAGHCFDGVDATQQVLQLSVPQSAVIVKDGVKVGIPRHPDPKYQFAVDASSVQYKLLSELDVDNAVDAEDWSYFGTFRNPNTGLTQREAANNQSYTLAKVTNGVIAPGQAAVGDVVTITGFGNVRDQARKNLRLTQQVATGSLASFPDKYHINHRVDTEGGNSGSAMVVKKNGKEVAVGIHTNGGCDTTASTSANYGSSVNQRGYQAALAAPKGVCKA
ncbi:hypothetical protein GGF31_008619 [Allomyces arbusculus]|nr:hypothetical protein GGF31_008619 [Allomyces arbusculus]